MSAFVTERHSCSKQMQSSARHSATVQRTSKQKSHDSSSSSAYQPHGTPRNVFSIVSKFEQLDALSLPLKLGSLRPAALSTSHRVSERYSGAVLRRRLSTIFSPGSGSTSNSINFGSITKDISAQEPLLGAYSTLSSGDTAKNEVIQKLPESRKRSSIRLKNIFRTTATHHRGGESKPITNAGGDQGGGIAKRKRTMRDMIRFYDGSVSGANNTQARSSITQTAGLLSSPPSTPSPKRSHNHCELSCGEKNGLAEPAGVSVSVKSTCASSIRTSNPVARSPVSKYSFTPTSPSKSEISRSSDRKHLKIQNSVGRSDRRNRFEGQSNVHRTEKVTGNFTGAEQTPSWQLRGEVRGSNPAQNNGGSPRRSRNKITDDDETAHRNNVLDVHAKHVDFCEQETRVIKCEYLNGLTKLQFGQPAVGKASSVAQMKRFFDGSTSSIVQSPKKALTEPKAPSRNASFRVKAASGSFDFAMVPSPPALLPIFRRIVKPVVSPVLFKHFSSNQNEEHSPTMRPEWLAQYPSPVHGLQREKNKWIRDRIELFEKINAEQANTKTGRKQSNGPVTTDSSTITARKDLIEIRSPGPDSSNRGFRVNQIQRIINGLQDGAVDSTIGKRKIVAGRWNPIVERHHSNQTKENDKSGYSSLESDGSEMVVKEAHCALRQPKPMRAAEVKRMRLLCRDKEKGKAVRY